MISKYDNTGGMLSCAIACYFQNYFYKMYSPYRSVNVYK